MSLTGHVSMKRISWGCVIVGVVSILLSFIGIFLPLDGLRRWNLPFQVLIISLKCGSIPFPKPMALNFINILSLPLFDYFFSIVLIVSGIGTLWMRRWGRFLGYIYAMSIILISGLSFPTTLIGYIREFSNIEKYGFLQGIIWAGALLYVLTLLGTLLYPIILLIFFSRPKIKEKFNVKR